MVPTMRFSILFLIFPLVCKPVFANNVSIIVHESVINGLFGALGTIYKNTTLFHIWIINPRVTIHGERSQLTAQAHLKNFAIDRTFDVIGKVKASPSENGENIKISTYDVVIKDTAMGNINISDWYDLKFDMPVSIPNNATIADKSITIKQTNFQAIMGENQIELYSDIEFLPINPSR